MTAPFYFVEISTSNIKFQIDFNFSQNRLWWEVLKSAKNSISQCTIALDGDSAIDQDCSEMTLCCSSESRCKSGPTQIATGPFLYLWKAKSRQKWTHDTISLWREAYICCILLQRKSTGCFSLFLHILVPKWIMSCSYEIFNIITLSTEQVSNYGTEKQFKKAYCRLWLGEG